MCCREATEEYGEEVVQLCRRVMRLLSTGLGLEAGRLQAAFGGEGGEGACMRVNFYPRCPQPELTLGVAAHSDPGGMTMLLVDDHVRGLQVRSPDAGKWITVDPVPDAFIVNIGDQIQVRRSIPTRRYEPYLHVVQINSNLTTAAQIITADILFAKSKKKKHMWFWSKVRIKRNTKRLLIHLTGNLLLRFTHQKVAPHRATSKKKS